jgi:hypothetical protein
MKNYSNVVEKALAEKKLEGAWEARHLVKLLDEFEAADLMTEKKMAGGKKLAIAGGIGAFASLFISIFLVALETTEYGFYLIPVFLVLLAVGLVRYFQAKKHDLPDELRKVVRPLVRQLGQDFAPGEKLRLRVDLAGLTDGKKHQGEFRQKIFGDSTTAYGDALLELEMPLADGTTAVLEVENSYLQSVRSRRNSRGKTKTKTKWKKLSAVTATMIPAGPVRWGGLQLDKDWERLKIAEKKGVEEARLTRYWQWKSVGDEPKETAEGSEVVGLFVRLASMKGGA